MITLVLAASVLIGVSLGILGGGGSILTVPILDQPADLDRHRLCRDGAGGPDPGGPAPDARRRRYGSAEGPRAEHAPLTHFAGGCTPHVITHEGESPVKVREETVNAVLNRLRRAQGQLAGAISLA
ncbi:hypothetical protein ACIBL6_19160 [Streptomyces sp. NPDC050400]|uniref:hypothetical protein n=1 Tax=Streptomyces sp. NPDC050400 TaxID=3365610 RepID=UPI00378788E6